MRVLAAIAHHGTKNRAFLDMLLREYANMAFDVDVVVLTEVAKDLGDVEQVVGLPTNDPWSLPFGHRQLFADRREAYDLFVYSEDDILVTERHLRAFLELSDHAPADCLPGFLRYELDGDGQRSWCDSHSFYRWDPTSLFRHDGRTYANYSNEHAAAYVLTRQHLDRAIDSGGFLVAPHAGRYDMLVTAATDPYTQCGLRKVLCLERLDEQMVHHLPNVYLDKYGLPDRVAAAEVDALLRAADRGEQPAQYLVPEGSLDDTFWWKSCHPRPSGELAGLLGDAKRVLVLGGGSGEREARLAADGRQVTVVPIDGVLGAAAAARGLETAEPRLLSRGGHQALEGREFDAVVAVDVLPYLPDPVSELRAATALLVPGGRVVATVPDHARYALRNRVPRGPTVRLPRGFVSDGVHLTGRRWLRRRLRSAGLEVQRLEPRRATRIEPVGHGGRTARLLGNTWLAVGARP